MKVWQIALTVYCTVGVVLNLVVFRVRIKESERHFDLGKAICSSNELLDRVAELEKENLSLRLELEYMEKSGV